MSLTGIARVWVALSLLGELNASQSHAQRPDEPAEPKASPAVQELLDEATAQDQAKRPGEALAKAERALVAAHAEKDAAAEARAQRIRARAFSALNRTEAAVTAWEAAVDAWARAGDGPGQIEALVSMAIQLDVKQPDKAAILRVQALRLGQSESRRRLAAAQELQMAGQIYLDRQALSRAQEFFSAALSLREREEPNSLEAAASLNNLGAVARQQGDLAAARDYHRKALAIREEKAPNSRDVAASLNNLGIVARHQGDLAAARDYFRRAWAIQKEETLNSVSVASSLNNLGIVAQQQGDLAAARDYYQQALAIWKEKVPNSPDVAGGLNNLGIVARQRGDSAAARDYYQQALTIWKARAPDSLQMALTLNNLGIVALHEGDLAAARDYFRRALAIREEKAPNSLDVAASLNSLGVVAIQQGHLSAARDYLRRALAIREEKAPNSLYVATSLHGLGLVAQQERDFAAAHEYFRKALAIREEEAAYSLDLAESLYELGKLAEHQSELAEAKDYFLRAWQLVQNQTEALSGDEARQAFGTSTQFYAVTLIRSQLSQGELQAAFSTLEESRAQALQRLLLEKQGLAKAVESTLWSEYQVAVASRNRAEQAASKASIAELLAQRDIEVKQKERAAQELVAKAQEAKQAAAKKSERARSDYTHARLKSDALWADIKKSLPRALVPPALTLKQASQAVPRDTLFIAFSVGEEQTDVFLLRPQTYPESSPLSTYSVALSSKELRRLVEQLRLQVVRPSRRTAGTMAGRGLFAALFPANARKEIAGAERLLISPDGPLWEVPFAALVTNELGAPRYLGASKAMTYTPSLALFAQTHSEPRRPTSGDKLAAVVVGNPIFNRAVLAVAGAKASRRRQEMKREVASLAPAPGFGERSYLFLDGQPPEPLPETEREAIAVARLYGGTPLLREQATEGALRQQIETADVIHLATHGYLHPVRAMSSGVLLTVPEKEPERGETDNDGALQAWEIYSQLKLKAELVVLSACETGRGQEVKGEGLVGLTRALQYAGARSIVASQWKVADQSTSKLMVAFHRSLRQGVPKDEALRKAMALVRENPATRHPYYWAPFILAGDSDNSLMATFGTSR